MGNIHTKSSTKTQTSTQSLETYTLNLQLKLKLQLQIQLQNQNDKHRTESERNYTTRIKDNNASCFHVTSLFFVTRLDVTQALGAIGDVRSIPCLQRNMQDHTAVVEVAQTCEV